MAGYRVVLEELDEAADAAGELAERGASVDVAGAVEQAPVALPGSRAESKLRGLARTMRDETAELVSDTRSYGSNVSHAAEYYRAHEKQAARELHGVVAEFGVEVAGPG